MVCIIFILGTTPNTIKMKLAKIKADDRIEVLLIILCFLLVLVILFYLFA